MSITLLHIQRGLLTTSVSMICGWVDANTMASIQIAHDSSMLGINRDIKAAVSHYERVLLIMGVSM